MFPELNWLRPLEYRTAYEPSLPARLLTELDGVKYANGHRAPGKDSLALQFAPMGSWPIWEGYLKQYEAVFGTEKGREAHALVKSVVLDCLNRVLEEKKRNPELRPFQVDPSIQYLGKFESTSSHTSGHSAIAYAAATTLAQLWPSRAAEFLAAAANVGRSRVYMGVHFPGDVGAGARFGRSFALEYLTKP